MLDLPHALKRHSREVLLSVPWLTVFVWSCAGVFGSHWCSTEPSLCCTFTWSTRWLMKVWFRHRKASSVLGIVKYWFINTVLQVGLSIHDTEWSIGMPKWYFCQSPPFTEETKVKNLDYNLLESDTFCGGHIWYPVLLSSQLSMLSCCQFLTWQLFLLPNLSMMSIFCGRRSHWLLLSDLMHARCLMELSAVLAAFQEAPCIY